MKRPERPVKLSIPSKQGKAYNLACDDWERFLPNKEEVEKTIRDIGAPRGLPLSLSVELAEKISSRLKGD